MKTIVTLAFLVLFCTPFFAQKTQKETMDFHRNRVKCSLNDDRSGSSTFLLQKIDGYDGEETIIQPKPTPDFLQTFTYFSDNRLRSLTYKYLGDVSKTEYTYLNSQTNLYSSVIQTSSFGNKEVDSFFYDANNRATLKKTYNSQKELTRLDSFFFDGQNKNFTKERIYNIFIFPGFPPFAVLNTVVDNTISNDFVKTALTTYYGFDGKKTFDIKYEFVFDPINNVFAKTQFIRDTAQNSPWTMSIRENKGFNNEGQTLYETTLGYNEKDKNFDIIDSLHNVYLNQNQLEYADEFFVINGNLLLYGRIVPVYDKNENLDSLKFMIPLSPSDFQLYAYEKYFWKEIKMTSAKDLSSNSFDFEVLENNPDFLSIKIVHPISDMCYVQLTNINGQVVKRIKTPSDEIIRLENRDKGLFFLSVFDEKGNVKSRKIVR